jgi:hypothetical protein
VVEAANLVEAPELQDQEALAVAELVAKEPMAHLAYKTQEAVVVVVV